MNNWTGYLELQTKRSGEKTVLHRCYHYNGYKITRPIYPNNSKEAWVYVLSVGGGYVQDDSYCCTINVVQDTHLHLRTQGGTKVYRTERTPPFQYNCYHVGEDATFTYLPDPLILYEDAKFIQKTEVYLAKSSRLLYGEIITPGWSKDGTFFSYQLLQSDVKIYMENQLILLDRLRLSREDNIHEIGYLEGYSHLGSLYVINQNITSSFISKIRLQFENETDVKVGISQLPFVNGILIRLFSRNTWQIEERMKRILNVIVEEEQERLCLGGKEGMKSLLEK